MRKAFKQTERCSTCWQSEMEPNSNEPKKVLYVAQPIGHCCKGDEWAFFRPKHANVQLAVAMLLRLHTLHN